MTVKSQIIRMFGDDDAEEPITFGNCIMALDVFAVDWNGASAALERAAIYPAPEGDADKYFRPAKDDDGNAITFTENAVKEVTGGGYWRIVWTGTPSDAGWKLSRVSNIDRLA